MPHPGSHGATSDMAARPQRSDACLGDDMDTILAQIDIMDVCDDSPQPGAISSGSTSRPQPIPEALPLPQCHKNGRSSYWLHQWTHADAAQGRPLRSKPTWLCKSARHYQQDWKPAKDGGEDFRASRTKTMATKRYCGRGQPREPPICTIGFSLPLARRT